jgi:hypothetical protein
MISNEQAYRKSFWIFVIKRIIACVHFHSVIIVLLFFNLSGILWRANFFWKSLLEANIIRMNKKYTFVSFHHTFFRFNDTLTAIYLLYINILINCKNHSIHLILFYILSITIAQVDSSFRVNNNPDGIK